MSEVLKGSGNSLLVDWNPEDAAFWASGGRAVARRNLWISIPALLLSFAIWMVWSVVVVNLPEVGFDFTTNQLFWLASLPGLSGATLRIFYSFMVPLFGGRRWTTISTASLLLPAIGIGFAVQTPATPYWIFLLLALLCGFGGGNFASSMANISFFFPKAEKGTALGMNAGLGNLGVSVVQFVAPLVITVSVFGALAGAPQETIGGEEQLWLQNAGFVWVPFILISTAAAWFGMNDVASARASFRAQAAIFRRKHTWVMCWLYVGTFGSFIGYSAGFPLLARTQFPEVDSLSLAFLGPLVGAATRVGGGILADRLGGGRVTLWVFVVMIGAVLGALYFLSLKGSPLAFWGFFAMFLLLFAATGIGNASTFQMIPTIFYAVVKRAGETKRVPEDAIRRQSEREAAAAIGFTSAIAAFGAFFIPRSFGASMSLTGSASGAFATFLVFYLTCIALTWWFYTRRRAEIPC